MARNSAQAGQLRIGVYDACPLRVEGLLALFGAHQQFRFVPTDLYGLTRDPSLDMALVGLHGPFDAVAMVAAFRALRPTCPVVLMGPPARDEQLLTALSAGAKGYIEDTATPDQVELAIGIVREGSIWVPRRVLALFVDRANARERTTPRSPAALRFTAREQQVLRELAAARSNPEIARTLGLEERTVKMHLSRLMRKVGVENRVALTTAVLTHGLLENSTGAESAATNTAFRVGNRY